jgi:hypothetical protein
MPFCHRHLPHWYEEWQAVFLTWRLHGSLPANSVFPSTVCCGKAFAVMYRLLDEARSGPFYLR